MTPRAVADLDELTANLGLPADARRPVQRSLRLGRQFPRAGRRLGGRWAGTRFTLGPWPWMVLLYRHDEPDDAVFVVAVHDARSSSAATSP